MQVSQIEKQLEKERELGTKPREPIAYVGSYWNSVRSFHINITVQADGELYLCFQGLQNETYRLRHYHHDVFVWTNPIMRQRGEGGSKPVRLYPTKLALSRLAKATIVG